MPTTNEWKTVNRRTALAHAISRGSDGPYKTAEEVVEEAETFRKFLDGEANG